MDEQTGQQRANDVIMCLDGLRFVDQLSILIATMLSTIIANAPETGDQVLANIMDMLPRQYMQAKSITEGLIG
jgi:hypothetical protein